MNNQVMSYKGYWVAQAGNHVLAITAKNGEPHPEGPFKTRQEAFDNIDEAVYAASPVQVSMMDLYQAIGEFGLHELTADEAKAWFASFDYEGTWACEDKRAGRFWVIDTGPRHEIVCWDTTRDIVIATFDVDHYPVEKRMIEDNR